jgi:hypothetical protein
VISSGAPLIRPNEKGYLKPPLTPARDELPDFGCHSCACAACKRERGEEKPRTSGGSEAGQLSPGPHVRHNDQSSPEQTWATLEVLLVKVAFWC